MSGTKGRLREVPEAPAEGDGGEHADDGEDGLRAGEPLGGEQGAAVCGSAVGGAVLFNAGDDAGDEDEERRPDGEGVVLLVGGDGEEEQRPGGEEARAARWCGRGI